MPNYVNPFIAKMTRVFPPQGRYGKLRYDMNENPEGLPRDFVDSVLKEITPEFLAIYPEPDCFLRKYAEFVGVKFENVMCTNGSDQAIRYLLETFGEVGKEVVTVAPSFEMYWVNCMLLGYKHVPVAYEPDLSLKIEKIVAAITEKTRIVVLLNPNNPVGNVYTDDEAAWRKAMSALLPNAHPTAVVKPPFRCDFGTEIHLGEKAFVNFNCTILDGAKVTIGARTLIGPDCGIYTPEHPIDWQERNRGIERLKPVTIGEDCWIGGHVTILPGVTIGARSIVAAGSVVVDDVPEDVMVAGNPAVVKKSLKCKV